MNPLNHPPVLAKKFTVPFAALSKSLEVFDGFDHQNTPEDHLLQIDSHISFTIEEPPIDPVTHIRQHQVKMSLMQCFLPGLALV